MKVTTKGQNPMFLTPKLFNKILCLPSANKPLKLLESDTFLSSQVGSANILREFIISYASMPTNLSRFDITLIQEPYWDFS
jgi:hypothetical protein